MNYTKRIHQNAVDILLNEYAIPSFCIHSNSAEMVGRADGETIIVISSLSDLGEGETVLMALRYIFEQSAYLLVLDNKDISTAKIEKVTDFRNDIVPNKAAFKNIKTTCILLDYVKDELSYYELPKDYPQSEPSVFRFIPSEEHSAVQTDGALPQCPTGWTSSSDTAWYLFEPGKALMKSGGFNLIGSRFNIAKLGRSTHYYTFCDSSMTEDLKGAGKVYEIIRCESLDKRTLKAAGKDFPKAEVTARNIPMDTDTLRKKLGVTSGDDAHIFGLKSDKYGNLLLCTKRVL